MKKLSTRDIAIVAALIAIGVICAMPFPYGLTFYTPDKILKFSPGFVITALVARRYNPVVCGITAGLIDLFQAFLSSMVPNPIISLSSILTGVIFGLIFKGDINFKKVLSVVLLTQIICSLGITTFALWFYYHQPIEVLMVQRLIQVGFFIVVELVVLPLLFIKTDIAKRVKLVQ